MCHEPRNGTRSHVFTAKACMFSESKLQVSANVFFHIDAIVLGGTEFLGHHMYIAAVDCGWLVLFHHPVLSAEGAPKRRHAQARTGTAEYSTLHIDNTGA